MGTPNKYKKEYVKTAAKILADGKSKAAVCAALDISRRTFYDWCATHEEFNDAVDIGMQKCQAMWEEIGEHGIKGNYDKFGAAPWIFTMKNRFRDDYTDEKDEKGESAVSVLEKIITGEIKVKND
jgi:hypothetical protein